MAATGPIVKPPIISTSPVKSKLMNGGINGSGKRNIISTALKPPIRPQSVSSLVLRPVRACVTGFADSRFLPELVFESLPVFRFMLPVFVLPSITFCPP